MLGQCCPVLCSASASLNALRQQSCSSCFCGVLPRACVSCRVGLDVLRDAGVLGCHTSTWQERFASELRATSALFEAGYGIDCLLIRCVCVCRRMCWGVALLELVAVPTGVTSSACVVARCCPELASSMRGATATRVRRAASVLCCALLQVPGRRLGAGLSRWLQQGVGPDGARGLCLRRDSTGSYGGVCVCACRWARARQAGARAGAER